MRRIDAPRRQHSGPVPRPRRRRGLFAPYRGSRVDAGLERRDGRLGPAGGDGVLEPRADLRVVPRRRLAANAAALAVVLIGVLMLSAVVLHTRLSERQLEIDRLEREVVSAHAVFDVLRQQRAELRSPTRLAAESSRLGMHPAPASDFLAVDPWALARVLATRGTIDPNDGTLNESDPLDQVRRVRAASDGVVE
jgi:hypothetical protein